MRKEVIRLNLVFDHSPTGSEDPVTGSRGRTASHKGPGYLLPHPPCMERKKVSFEKDNGVGWPRFCSTITGTLQKLKLSNRQIKARYEN